MVIWGRNSMLHMIQLIYSPKLSLCKTLKNLKENTISALH